MSTAEKKNTALLRLSRKVDVSPTRLSHMPNIETTDLLSQNQRYLLRLLTYSKLFIKPYRGDRGFCIPILSKLHSREPHVTKWKWCQRTFGLNGFESSTDSNFASAVAWRCQVSWLAVIYHATANQRGDKSPKFSRAWHRLHVLVSILFLSDSQKSIIHK